MSDEIFDAPRASERAYRDEEAEACAKIAESICLWSGRKELGQHIAETIRIRITARYAQAGT